MRHAGEIGDDRLAADGLAKAKRQFGLVFFEILRGQQFAQINGLAFGIRQLDADGVTAGNNRDTARYGTQAEAINRATEIARNQQSEVLIHGRDGRIRERNSYGNDPFPPRG